MKVLLILLMPALCSGALRADINGDGRVDYKDFAILAEEWLMSENYLEFDGSGYVTIPSRSFADGDSWTVCFWAWLKQFSGTVQYPIGEYNTNNNYIALRSDISYTGINFYNDAGGSKKWVLSTRELYQTWKHVAIVSSGTIITLYLDGISQGSKTMNTSFDSINCLGAAAVGGSYTGYLDDVRIYSMEMNSVAIGTIYYDGYGCKAVDENFYNGWYSNCDGGLGLLVNGRLITNGVASDSNGVISDADHVTRVAGGVPFNTQMLTKEPTTYTHYMNVTSRRIQARFRGNRPFKIHEYGAIEPEVLGDR